MLNRFIGFKVSFRDCQNGMSRNLRISIRLCLPYALQFSFPVPTGFHFPQLLIFKIPHIGIEFVELRSRYRYLL